MTNHTLAISVFGQPQSVRSEEICEVMQRATSDLVRSKTDLTLTHSVPLDFVFEDDVQIYQNQFSCEDY